LDGTWLPLDGNRQNQRDLVLLGQLLRQHKVCLVYVTGRHRASVERAIREHLAPRPDWIICDVGTTIYRMPETGDPAEVTDYARHLSSLIAPLPIDRLRAALNEIAGLRLQEPEKQGRFKLSYYADRSELDELCGRLQEWLAKRTAPYSIIRSVDPFTGDGLIDLLPEGVSKAHALRWWTGQAGLDDSAVVFAGDSGNDRAAFLAGYRAIVVGNADRGLADEIRQAHRRQGWSNRLYLAEAPATSGVLEGCRWFGLFPTETQDDRP
jgi:hydroxymethylpyrimidine pyrophosphatase-like HAD family hydrolase